MRFVCARACLPHKMKTHGRSESRRYSITDPVRLCQPKCAWLPGSPSDTVKTSLRSKTPCRGKCSKTPSSLNACKESDSGPTSSASSFKIFRKEGGQTTPCDTENAKPWACPRPWYGSWPKMTTLTALGTHERNAASSKPWGGYHTPCARAS